MRLAPRVPGDLARQDRGRHFGEAYEPHPFAETGQQPVADRFGRFRRHVARRGPGAARGQDQRAADAVGERDQRRLDLRPLVGDEPALRPPRAHDEFGERGLYAGPPLILIDALGGAIGYRHDADGYVRQRNPRDRSIGHSSANRLASGPGTITPFNRGQNRAPSRSALDGRA